MPFADLNPKFVTKRWLNYRTLGFPWPCPRYLGELHRKHFFCRLGCHAHHPVFPCVFLIFGQKFAHAIIMLFALWDLVAMRTTLCALVSFSFLALLFFMVFACRRLDNGHFRILLSEKEHTFQYEECQEQNTASLPLSQTVTSLFTNKISTWIWTVHSVHYPMYVLNIMLMKCPKRHWESPKKKIQKTQRRTHNIVNDRWKDPIKGLIKFWRTECFVWECSGSYNSNMIQIPINFFMIHESCKNAVGNHNGDVP